MATSPYFQSNYDAKYADQAILEDIITESIRISGFDGFYCPNNNDAARDLLFGEDPTKKFQTAFPIEMYLSSSSEYLGEKDFFTKFGLEIKNNVTVIISKRAFTQRAPANSLNRPREGDLIYIPVTNGTGELFEIKFTNQTKDFFMLGRKVPYYYELELEKFKYSNEVISTGISDIDQVVSDSGYTLHLNVGTGAGTYGYQELVFQSPDNTLANAYTTAIVQSWNKPSNILSVTNIKGTFSTSNNNNIIGKTSGASYALANFDVLNSPSVKENYDNSVIAVAGNTYNYTGETNSFGQI